jgi:hypothetical protein
VAAKIANTLGSHEFQTNLTDQFENKRATAFNKGSSLFKINEVTIQINM